MKIDQTQMLLVACAMCSTRFEVEQVRTKIKTLGLKISGTMLYTRLKMLIERGTIELLHREESIGRPAVYTLTQKGIDEVGTMKRMMTTAVQSLPEY